MAKKIIGNTVGIPNPQTDFKQSDPTKADYLKNSPVDTIEKMKRFVYYGDADIIPSDSSLFIYTLNADGQSYTIKKGDVSLSGKIVIPYEYNGLPITAIDEDAFQYRSRITNITIPSSITSIGSGAFRSCDEITNITIPNSVTSIGSYAFRGCTSLTSITIPVSVTSIGGNAFFECTSFNDVYYEGTEEQWKAIGNSILFLSANIHYDWTPAMKGELSNYVAKEDIGNIETALDNIIAIQNTLIGGGSV